MFLLFLFFSVLLENGPDCLGWFLTLGSKRVSFLRIPRRDMARTRMFSSVLPHAPYNRFGSVFISTISFSHIDHLLPDDGLPLVLICVSAVSSVIRMHLPIGK
jgi:hypothetical protein